MTCPLPTCCHGLFIASTYASAPCCATVPAFFALGTVASGHETDKGTLVQFFREGISFILWHIIASS